MKRILFYFLIVAASFPFEALAQQITRGARETALAGGGAAYVRDTDALFLNPANIVLHERGANIVVTVGRVSAFAGGDMLQFAHYNNAFTGGNYISPSDARILVDNWFGGLSSDMRYAGVSADVVPLAATLRLGNYAVGLSSRVRTTSKVGLNGGWFDVILVGEAEDRDVPLHSDLQFQATTEIGASIAGTFLDGRLALGATPKLVLGAEHFDNRLESTVTISQDEIRHAYNFQTRSAGGFATNLSDQLDIFGESIESDFDRNILKGAGTGFGLDFGGTYEINNMASVAASITDLGSISWKQNAQRVTPNGNELLFEGIVLDLDRIDEQYGGDLLEYAGDVLDSLASNAYDDVTKELGGFSTPLPTALHVGGMIKLVGGRMKVTGGSSVSLNNGPSNVSRAPSFYVGGEFRPGKALAFPLRAGVRVAGNGAATIGAGFGIETPVYDFNLGVAMTPFSDWLGAGGRYQVSLSLLNLRL